MTEIKTITDELLKEIVASPCICQGCFPDLLAEVRDMAEELLALRRLALEVARNS